MARFFITLRQATNIPAACFLLAASAVRLDAQSTVRAMIEKIVVALRVTRAIRAA
jgi:hypothetical protein